MVGMVFVRLLEMQQKKTVRKDDCQRDEPYVSPNKGDFIVAVSIFCIIVIFFTLTYFLK